MTAPTPAQIQSYIGDKVKYASAPNRDGWRKIHCPKSDAHTHGDRNASATINVNSGHIECHACGLKGLVGKIYDDLGWPAPSWNGHNGSAEPGLPTTWKGFPITKWHHYTDEYGAILYSKGRYTDANGKKQFVFWCQGSAGFRDKKVRRVPYKLHNLGAAEEIIVVEGESDVEAGEELGFICTTTDTGARGNPGLIANLVKSEQRVVVFGDEDTEGEAYRLSVLTALYGKVPSLKSPHLPGLQPGKKDLRDWKDARREDLTGAAEELSRIIEGAEEWKPEEKPNEPIGFQPPAHWKFSDLADARVWECTPLQAIIKDLGIFKGTFILLAAMSQAGKTLLILYLIRRMISGGLCFAKFPVNSISKLLYFVLEDPDRRIKSRWLDHDEPDIEQGRAFAYMAPGFKLNDDACFSHLEDLIKTGGFEVVILDTYQKATPGISSFNDEQQSLILHKMAELTRKYNVTIIVLDHIRKGDSGKRRKEISLEDIKGTGGKAQNADTVILLERTGGKLKLTATSKDLDAPVGFLLDIAPQGSTGEKFQFAGNLDQMASDMKEVGQQNKLRVLDAYDFTEWQSRKYVAETIQMSASTVAKHTAVLFKEGSLEQQGSGSNTKYRRISSETSVRSENTPRTISNKGLYDNN